ncbi:MAG: L-glutamate gamma-semialdehyde dehydrogenase [bacterium]
MITKEFENNKVNFFKTAEEQNLMKEAIKKVEKTFSKEYPIVMNGKEIMNSAKIKSVNPSKPSEVVGFVSKASKEQAIEALESAHRNFQWWSRESQAKRSAILLRAAEIMRQRKMELNAVMVTEAGKNWVEADADTAEAIDFLEFYAREGLRYSKDTSIVKINGEDNRQFYIPLGVGVVIPPWNFPLAITTGMTTAALVTGNTVILKPASDTPVIAYKLYEILKEAGLPDGVLTYLPGSGGEVGDTLVDHPLTRFITFTGSMEIGIRIYERASKVNPGQKWLKRVIAEMGGKDYIIVENDGDIESAANGIVQGAFGFQGQKCSACSRAIINKDVYDKMVSMIKERTEKIIVGDTRDFRVPEVHYYNMGPVANIGSKEKIMEYIEFGKKNGRLVTGGSALDINGGYFIQPTVFADIKPKSKLEQEEIFGPVLSIIKSDSLEHSIEIANDTNYGLTGAIYTKSRANLEKAAKELFTGTLYLNRGCTGALVGVHPFGGFNMSGTDSKAGGTDYLLLFLQAKMVSEKV